MPTSTPPLDDLAATLQAHGYRVTAPPWKQEAGPWEGGRHEGWSRRYSSGSWAVTAHSRGHCHRGGCRSQCSCGCKGWTWHARLAGSRCRGAVQGHAPTLELAKVRADQALLDLMQEARDAHYEEQDQVACERPDVLRLEE